MEFIDKNVKSSTLLACTLALTTAHVVWNWRKYFGTTFRLIKKWPGISYVLNEEHKKIKKDLRKDLIKNSRKDITQIPIVGWTRKKILSTLSQNDELESTNWRAGKLSGAVYYGYQKHFNFVNKAYAIYSPTNPLHPSTWPSLRQMEAEIIRMTVTMFHGGSEHCGILTSGGTESILLAMLAYRNFAKAERGINEPELIIPVSAHPAFEKAAHYFGIKLIKIPLLPNYKVDTIQMEQAITDNTICLVGSAPAYPHGIIDDITTIAKIAKESGLPMHVDGCLGGFLLPWLRKINKNLPQFDFNVPGVTSISADTHKYAYAPKGTSVVSFSSKLYRKYAYFTSTDWPGGLYASHTLQGSRSGGNVAACWAAMVNIGQKGYLEKARGIYKCAQTILAGLNEINDIRVIGAPQVMVIAFTTTSSKLSIYTVLDVMKKKGWSLNPLQRPAAVHLCCTCETVGKEQLFLTDLTDSIADAKLIPYKESSALVYGMTSSFPDRSEINDLETMYLDVLLETSADI